jgi:hypothetical protein
VLLAELEVFHSRPIAPTRRVALGRRVLPSDPAPGFGGILLGGIVAAHMPELDPDLFDDLHRLTLQLQEGMRIPQPRLRHRLQHDRIGLLRSVHRLIGEGEDLEFDFEDKGAAAQHILAAVYAAGDLPPGVRGRVMDAVRAAMRWSGQIDRTLVAHLTGLDRARPWSADAFHDPVRWALTVLGLGNEDGNLVPGRGDVQRQFRVLVREAHPDHGGDRGDAASRIAELTEARRILLAS